MSGTDASWYWYTLGIIAVARGAWWLQFVTLSIRGSSSAREAFRRVRSSLTLSTKDELERLTSQKPTDLEQLDKAHETVLGIYRTQRAEALTLGSLGLAAWGVLYTLQGSPGTVAPVSLDLLFVGVMLTISGPTIFPMGGAEGTRMGLETTLAIGYGAVVLALASLLPSVVAEELRVIAFIVMAALLAREGLNVRAEWTRTSRLLPVAAPHPSASPGASPGKTS